MLLGGIVLAIAMEGRVEAASDIHRAKTLWSQRPILRPPFPESPSPAPTGAPIDRFLGGKYSEKGIHPLPAADRLTWLRRVTLDLTGLPPTVEEQQAFLSDESSDAFGRVVDRLLANPQHGVQYGRHWLDVLRYTDVDEDMPAAPGIYLWRDWVIAALNHDLPYDAFVRAQICGQRAAERTQMTATGHRIPVDPRPEDLFALGFLSRGASRKDNSNQQLAISAVETISSAFLGLTVGCAKCHDHFYDPIQQTDFYSMKALFDPLALRRVELATSEQRFAQGLAWDAYEAKKRALQDPINALIEPYRSKLYEERLKLLPAEVQAAIRKPEKERDSQEQKVADDYFPVLRIDPGKIKEIMPREISEQYSKALNELNALKAPEPLPGFFTVEEDPQRAAEKRYVLTTGDPTRPKLTQPVEPGFPFSSKPMDVRAGRREAFVDWLTAPENPFFARVVVNRIWYWHFGTPLHNSVTDFGSLGGTPTHPELLDWLASEFIAHHYSMKWLHKEIVLSEVYRRASMGRSEDLQANQTLDPENRLFWKFPLRRLEAEPIRDALLFVSGQLDLSIGGPSFKAEDNGTKTARRSMYLQRGFRADSAVMPAFLETFDVDDGRVPCPVRNQTVTAPQALFLMNNALVHTAASAFAKRFSTTFQKAPNDWVQAAYRECLARGPSSTEEQVALDFLKTGKAQPQDLAWLLFNLDEFIYVR